MVAALIVSGCSLTRLAYDNLSFVVMHEADDYLDITAEQEARLRASFMEIHQAHREQALPRYVALLRATRNTMLDGADARELGCFVRAVEVLYADLMSRLVPLAAEALSLDLAEQQRRTLARAIARENADYEQKYLQGSIAERIEKRQRKAADRLEFWIGPLSEEQRRDIEEMLAVLPDRFDEWRDYRMGKQQELLALVDAGASREALEAFLNDWWVDHRGWPYMDEARASVTRILAAVEERMTPEQRRHLLEKLTDLADDFEALTPGGGVIAGQERLCALVAAAP
jgi:hypothetical protein